MDIRLGQPELRHHRPRRLNFLLRYPTIGFGDMPHQLEGDAKKYSLYRLRTAGAAPLLALHIEQMTDEHADQRACQPASCKPADQAADHFAVPHLRVLPSIRLQPATAPDLPCVTTPRTARMQPFRT